MVAFIWLIRKKNTRTNGLIMLLFALNPMLPALTEYSGNGRFQGFAGRHQQFPLPTALLDIPAPVRHPDE